MNIRRAIGISLLLGAALTASTGQAQAVRAYDSTFLTNYELLKPRTSRDGKTTDMAYFAPEAMQKLSGYKAVMIDQPAIYFSPDSPVKGMQPDDQKALAEHVREMLSAGLTEGGYTIAQQPGPDVLFVRVALTDVMVKKKKRGALAYLPIGAVLKLAADAVRETLSKVDFIEMTFQGELVDSVSTDVLGALVAPRGTRKAEGQKETRIDIDEFDQNVRAWSHRLRCQLDNSKLAADQQVDCTDDAANSARYEAKKS